MLTNKYFQNRKSLLTNKYLCMKKLRYLTDKFLVALLYLLYFTNLRPLAATLYYCIKYFVLLTLLLVKFIGTLSYKISMKYISMLVNLSFKIFLSYLAILTSFYIWILAFNAWNLAFNTFFCIQNSFQSSFINFCILYIYSIGNRICVNWGWPRVTSILLL